MKIIAELHSHTNVSGHAFNTLTEMISKAKNLDLRAIAITNHTPGCVDSPTSVHFNCYKYLPRMIEGIYLISGCEANIVDFEGHIDVPDRILNSVNFRIASKHEPLDMTFESRWGNSEENTKMFSCLMNNPNIDCIGHVCNSIVPFEYEPVIKAAAVYGKVIELNVSYLKRSKANVEAAYTIMRLCKKYDVLTAVTTDAHSIYVLGDNKIGIDLLDEISYPEELVINSSFSRLRDYFASRKGRDIFLDTMCI